MGFMPPNVCDGDSDEEVGEGGLGLKLNVTAAGLNPPESPFGEDEATGGGLALLKEKALGAAVAEEVGAGEKLNATAAGLNAVSFFGVKAGAGGGVADLKEDAEGAGGAGGGRLTAEERLDARLEGLAGTGGVGAEAG